MRKTIETSILLEMCSSDSDPYPAFHRIASKLVDTGSCITTMQASTMNFFYLDSFIKQRPYEGGIDLIELYFNRDEVINSAEFKRRMEYRKKTLATEMVELQAKLNDIKEQYQTICVMLDLE